jgi:hypothetical protein
MEWPANPFDSVDGGTWMCRHPPAILPGGLRRPWIYSTVFDSKKATMAFSEVEMER